MNNQLKCWVVYDHPADLPDYFIARLFVEGKPTGSFVQGKALELIRMAMLQMGLSCIPRDPSDDPVILETWL